jgi:hypothetical protein
MYLPLNFIFKFHLVLNALPTSGLGGTLRNNGLHYLCLMEEYAEISKQTVKKKKRKKRKRNCSHVSV